MDSSQLPALTGDSYPCNETKSVKMMYQETEFPLKSIPEMNCKSLEMPYKGKELSMLIFLPNDMEDSTTGLEKLEKELTYEKFVEWTRPDRMYEVEVQVGLPRFKMEKYDMKKVLVSMGMVDAFDMGKSDFSGMSPANDLVLSKVMHKAFVEVNEEGTEAAAATADMVMLCSYRPPATFIADHPFLFFIRHNPSMSILFAGRYCSPE
ncbi:leukocyte elastase inhibitor-like isoform X3 [Acanthochromis polyacanthus]|nr:leukocyte elastase inhibitor-like isoform X3 [Acanthochromis polyacanthus]